MRTHARKRKVSAERAENKETRQTAHTDEDEAEEKEYEGEFAEALALVFILTAAGLVGAWLWHHPREKVMEPHPALVAQIGDFAHWLCSRTALGLATALGACVALVRFILNG